MPSDVVFELAPDRSEIEKRGKRKRVSGRTRLQRVVNALERIANALEMPAAQAETLSWKTRVGCVAEALADAARARGRGRRREARRLR
jgi:hypothetical protein